MLFLIVICVLPKPIGSGVGIRGLGRPGISLRVPSRQINGHGSVCMEGPRNWALVFVLVGIQLDDYS